MVAEKAKSIAVAVDGSTAAWEAMQRAINMARLLAVAAGCPPRDSTAESRLLRLY